MIVVDFGTSTNFDVVSAAGEYVGGVLAPGIETSMEALFARAARLVKVDYVEPPSVIGKTTVGGLQSGVVYGFAGQVDGIVTAIRGELGVEARVVATEVCRSWWRRARARSPSSTRTDARRPAARLGSQRVIVQPQTLAVFALAALAILAVPGPAVIYIVTRSIHQGRAAGLASVLGIHVGTLVHLTFAVVGLSAILVSSATAFTVVKVLGALYLIVIGIRTLLGRADPRTPTRSGRRAAAAVTSPRASSSTSSIRRRRSSSSRSCRSSSTRTSAGRRCRSSCSGSRSCCSGSSPTRCGRSPRARQERLRGSRRWRRPSDTSRIGLRRLGVVTALTGHTARLGPEGSAVSSRSASFAAA